MLELGIVKTFDSQDHKAGVQLAGSLTTYLDDISVSVSIASSAMVVGNYVLVAIPGGNPRDACVVASWPAGSSGIRDHGDLGGLGDDDHSQYLNTARHDLTARHPLGTVVPHESALNNLGDVNIPSPSDDDVLYWDNAASQWKCKQPSGGGGGGTKIQDADGDTKVDVEESADEDKIRMDVKGVEAFLLHDDGILDLPKQSGCAVYLGTDQTIPSASHTVVNLDTELFDTLGEFNTTTHRFTATRAGIYIVIGATNWNNPNKSYQYAACIRKNGALVTETIFHSANYWRIGVMTAGIFSLAAGDYIELDAYQNSGAGDNLDAGINHTYMHIAKIA